MVPSSSLTLPLPRAEPLRPRAPGWLLPAQAPKSGSALSPKEPQYGPICPSSQSCKLGGYYSLLQFWSDTRNCLEKICKTARQQDSGGFTGEDGPGRSSWEAGRGEEVQDPNSKGARGRAQWCHRIRESQEPCLCQSFRAFLALLASSKQP